MIDIEKRLQEISKIIIEASLCWTGKDEEKNPLLKRVRTIAGVYLQKEKEWKNGKNN